MKLRALSLLLFLGTLSYPICTLADTTVIIQNTPTQIGKNESFPPLIMQDTYAKASMVYKCHSYVGLGEDKKLYVYFFLDTIGSASRIFAIKLIDASGNTFGYHEPIIKKSPVMGRYTEKYALALNPEIIKRLAKIKLVVQKGDEKDSSDLEKSFRQEIRSVYPNGSALVNGSFKYVLSPIPKPGAALVGGEKGDRW